MYVDAFLEKEKNTVYVVERSTHGKRIYREYPVEYVFYYPNQYGNHQSIFGTPVSKFKTNNHKEFRKELSVHSGAKLFESDINPVFRCLENNYLDATPPKLNVVFFDVEVAFDRDRGYAPTDDPFNEVTAITVYLDWMDQIITLAVPPKNLTIDTATDLVKDFSNTYLFDTEKQMLSVFLDMLDDADIITGWNSGGFDIPYLVNRIAKVLTRDDNRKWCLWDQSPKRRVYERFGSEILTYDLVGRVHMDYYDLYRKFTYEERHSYSLDAIGEYELGDRKVSYEGSLDQLYHQDFKKFIDYNRQDVMLVFKLDQKLKFMELANTLAHKNTVLLPTALGSVAMIEQAIINEAHKQGVVVPDKTRSDGIDTQAAGAYVAVPVKGMHEYIGSIDINSLYPSTLRALNMGQETIVGQIRPTMTDEHIANLMREGKKGGELWDGLFATLEYTAVMEMRDTPLILDWNDGKSEELSARLIWKLIFDSDLPWGLSANGTIFTFQKEAIVPGLLKKWYSQRKEFQAKLNKLIEKDAPKEEIDYWDRQQHSIKIFINSLYGAILNQHCKFFDKRIGQSTTLTGRSICKHMAAKVNELICEEYNHEGKSIIYGDTDSCYFSAWPIVSKDQNAKWDKEIAIRVYDSIADQVNESFPSFMEQAFHCPRSFGEIIRGGREIVARRGIFITKKRYAVMYYDKDGHRYDNDGKVGKLKAMGLDLKRSDTPKFVQKFLVEILEDVLNGGNKEDVIEKILAFKLQFMELPSWEKGTPKRVNNLTKFTVMYDKNARSNLPGHVRAAVNWNILREINKDNKVMKINDGQKTIVCKLRNNALNWTSIAYPIDEQHLPKWFLELPFDDNLMMTTIVDKKIDNVIGVLDWNLRESTELTNTFQSLFDF
jgi:DNA polymerase elongation subunit (family B)